MLRRLKTDLVDGNPILALPDMLVKDIDCELSAPEREFYDLLEHRMHEILADLLRKMGSKSITFYSTAFVLLLRLRQGKGFCSLPKIFSDQSLKLAYTQGY